MIRRIAFVLFCSLILFAACETSFAQTSGNHTMKVLTFPGLSNLDFAGFIITDNMKGTPNVFQIVINPADQTPVSLHGVLFWRDVGQRTGDGDQLVEFWTKPFPAHTLMNSDLGNTVQLLTHHENTTEIQKILDKGRPAGTFTLKLELLAEPSKQLQGSDVAVLSFDNPTQTIEIIYPNTSVTTQSVGMDISNIYVVWTSVQGIKGDNDTYYFIKAGQRRNSGQSLEDALSSGTPYIDNQKIIGNLTNINLASLPHIRQWSSGDEVVIQVGAHISGVGGGTNIYSQPVSYIVPAPSSTVSLSINLTQLLPLIPPAILKALTGRITFSGITDGNGNVLSDADVQAILMYLQAHPQNIISIRFNQ